MHVSTMQIEFCSRVGASGKMDYSEWKLNSKIFQKICSKLVTPEIDLFASRLSHQLKKHISWRPDSFFLSGSFL